MLGVKEPQQMMQKLDAATIGQEFVFSADNQKFYLINVRERSPKFELSTYVDAVRGGVLEDLAKRKITDEQLKKIVASIKSEAERAGLLKGDQTFTNDSAASLRFYPYVKASLGKLQTIPSDKNAETLVKDSKTEKSVENQFLLDKTHYSITKHSQDEKFDTHEIFALADGGWSSVSTPPNGDLYFFHLQTRSVDAKEGVDEKISQARKLLSDAVQKTMMSEIVTQLKNANALSLSYLDNAPEISPYEPTATDTEQDG